MINKKVIVFASIIAGIFLVKNVDFSGLWAWTGPVPNVTLNEVGKGQVAEGCVVENVSCDASGKNCKYSAVGRLKKCGHKEKEQTSTPTPPATATPTPVNTPTPTPTPSSTPEVTPTPTPPTASPNWCGGTCGSNSNCQNGLFCFIADGATSGYCRNPSCPGESSCGCVLGASTPPQLPKTGSDDWQILAGLLAMGAGGIYIFRRFKLV